MLPVLADMRPLFAVAFIISGSSSLGREGALGKKGTCSVFTVNIINLDDLKKKKKRAGTTVTRLVHTGAV